MANTNQDFLFGIGDVFLRGNGSGAITPKKVGTLQDLSLNFAGDTATLQTDSRFPVAIAAISMTVTGSFTIGSLQAGMMAEFLFDADKSEGSFIFNENKVTLPSDTPTYTATSFFEDLGVVYANGVILDNVLSSPKEGEYMYDAETGTYTFNAADGGKSVIVRYNSKSVTEGTLYTLTNKKMGSSKSFKLETISYYNGVRTGFILNNCIMTSVDLSKSNTDFAKPAINFSASVDEQDILGYIFVV